MSDEKHNHDKVSHEIDQEDPFWEDEPKPPRLALRTKMGGVTACWIAAMLLVGAWNLAPKEKLPGTPDLSPSPSTADLTVPEGNEIDRGPEEQTTVVIPNTTHQDEGPTQNPIGNQNNSRDTETLLTTKLGEPDGQPALWCRVYRSLQPHAIIDSGDGGFIIAGETGGDIFALRIDRDGNKSWQRTYGGGYSDFANDICLSGDGGFVVVGATCSNSSCKTADTGLVLRMDSNGTLLWETRLDGKARYVAPCLDGGYLITGENLVKIDANGSLLWTKDFGPSGHIIPADQGNNFIFNIPGDSLTKIDSEGEVIWKHELRANTTVRMITGTSDGGYAAAGYSQGHTYLLRIDAKGRRVWDRIYAGNYSEWTYSICQTEDGGFITTGSTGSYGSGWYDVHVLRVGSEGGLVWHRVYGGTDIDTGWDMVAGGENRYIVAADTYSFGSGYVADLYILCVEGLKDTPANQSGD